MKKTSVIVLVIILGIIGITGLGLAKRNATVNDKPETTTTTTPTDQASVQEQTSQPSQENKLCDWVDDSDIIIQLTFADGVTKDTSYEAGFYYSTIGSDMRLARSACNYRTGFSHAEMKNKGAVQVGVRGYTDSNRRQLENEPINVIFDENGKPSLESPIEVKVLN